MEQRREYSFFLRGIIRQLPHSKAGQAMVEYVLIAGIMVLSLSIMALFMYVFKEHGARALDLVSSEYP